MSYAKTINKMTFSFSRLHAYEQCPYGFYLKYIEERDGESNFYAANGKCMHEVFENIFKRKLPIEECTEYYTELFDSICEETRPSVMEKTYEKCMDYLCIMEDIDLKKYEIIGVELKLRFKIDKYNFVGYADLVVRNIENGEIIIVDHKQADRFMKKDGVTPLSNQKENFEAYKKQMYIYCKGLKDCFDIEVDKITWHHFKSMGAITKIPYNQEEFEETIKWVVDTISKIRKDKNFESKESFLMCKELCDYRNDCEYKEEY